MSSNCNHLLSTITNLQFQMAYVYMCFSNQPNTTSSNVNTTGINKQITLTVVPETMRPALSSLSSLISQFAGTRAGGSKFMPSTSQHCREMKGSLPPTPVRLSNLLEPECEKIINCGTVNITVTQLLMLQNLKTEIMTHLLQRQFTYFR